MNQLEPQTGVIIAHRFWRYVLGRPIRLLSWTSNMRWLPGVSVTGTNPDEGEQGIHGFKTAELMEASYRGESNHLLIRAIEITGTDGVVGGTVKLFGQTWSHENGYRATYGYPASFDWAIGEDPQEALAELRGLFS